MLLFFFVPTTVIKTEISHLTKNQQQQKSQHKRLS
jgi:hypothetical protein